MNNRFFDHLRTCGFRLCNHARPLVPACLCLLLALAACSGGGSSGTHTISGTVFAAAGNVIDADVNDPDTVDGDNDGFVSAQAITSPAIVGGYANQFNDPGDFYQVDLTSGQSVRLSVPISFSADIELYLYDRFQVQARSLTGVERTALFTIPSDDTYYLEVRAAAGASSYKLIVGDADALLAFDAGLDLSHAFVPGQAIVRWKPHAQPADAGNRLAMTTAATVGGDRFYLMEFDTGDQAAEVYGQLDLSLDRMAAVNLPALDTEEQHKYDTLQVIQALRERDDVEMAEPNYIRRAYLVPGDPQFDDQWHYDNINLPQAWDVTTGDPNVIVAVIDSGVLINHPDFAGQLVEGYDFISSAFSANDGDGRDEDPDDPGDSFANDSSFHGTHVAGTVAAAWDNGVGVAGVGGATRIMPVRVLGVDGGTDIDIIAGIRFAAGIDTVDTSTGTRPARAADIINLSLGGPAPSAALDAAVAAARDAGVIVIAAAGNSTSNQPEYPAASPGVIAVAATDLNNQRAYYTSFGATIDVAAPGGDLDVDLDGSGADDGVLSTGGSDLTGTIVNDYRYAQGTSMAAPHMAGVAALMKAVRPGLTPDELDAYLTGGFITTALTDKGLGAGLIDAQKAVQVAQVPGPPIALQAGPHAFYFNRATAAKVLTLEKLGSGALSVTSITADPGGSWLNVDSLAVDQASGLGTYRVVVDRTGLDGGIYTGAIDIVSSVNSIRIPVGMEVLPDITADAGRQHILVVEANTTNVVANELMTFDNGAYTFSVSGLATGSYDLYTGTDLDDDGLFLDAGEAYGAYPSADRPAALNVTGDTGGISFISGFSLNPIVTSNHPSSD